MPGISQFNPIKFQTSSGETCVATSDGGVVTIKGDKNGVRQVPIDKFMPEFIQDQRKVQLERTPKNDIVSLGKIGNSTTNTLKFSKESLKELDNSVNYDRPWYANAKGYGHMTGKGFDVDVSDKGFLNALQGKRSVTGSINDKEVNLKLQRNSGFGYNGSIHGTINGQEVDIQYKKTKDGIELENLSSENKDLGQNLALIANNKIIYDMQVDGMYDVAGMCV